MGPETVRRDISRRGQERVTEIDHGKERLAELVDKAPRTIDGVLARHGDRVDQVVPIQRAKQSRLFGSGKGES